MDDSRFNAYGSHCFNNLLIHLPSPMGDEEHDETLYILRRGDGASPSDYATVVKKVYGDHSKFMVTFIDRRDAERAQRESFTNFEIEEITGRELTNKLVDARLGANFKYVATGKADEIHVPPIFFEKYDEYLREGRPAASSSEFLRQLPSRPDFLSPKKMRLIQQTFEGLQIPGAVVTVRTVDLMGSTELVVDFDREGGITKKERARIDNANRRLQMRFGLPVPLFVNLEYDLEEVLAEQEQQAEQAQQGEKPAKAKAANGQREKRREKKQKTRNGKTQDDNFVCAQITNKIKRKQKTMEHPFVQHLVRASEIRKYEPLSPQVLDDENFDMFMHFDLNGDYIFAKGAVDVFLDEAMWRRSYDPAIHNEDRPQKTIRELLEFAEEHQASIRLHYPDKDGLDFITVPFAQLHAYHDLMPKVISWDIDELRQLPRVAATESAPLVEQATQMFRGIPGTASHAYVGEFEGRQVLVVEIEELKTLTEATDVQILRRSDELKANMPSDVELRFKVVQPIDRGPTSPKPVGR